MADPVHCPPSGARVEIPEAAGAEPEVTRDGMFAATPGRASITLAGETLHRCAEGRFLPPDRSD